ncbi:MAG: hypothetical protein ACRECH_18115 [Nitrososphaerales archaeon]
MTVEDIAGEPKSDERITLPIPSVLYEFLKQVSRVRGISLENMALSFMAEGARGEAVFLMEMALGEGRETYGAVSVKEFKREFPGFRTIIKQLVDDDLNTELDDLWEAEEKTDPQKWR